MWHCRRRRPRTRLAVAAPGPRGGGSTDRSTLTFVAFERITVHPDQMGGLPCIRGLRVTVSAIVRKLAAGRTTDELLTDYPYLECADGADPTARRLRSPEPGRHDETRQTYRSTYPVRLAREEPTPAAWSSAEMPSGTLSAMMSTRVPPSMPVTCQVIVIVPSKAGSSATKSTSCTTRTSVTMSTKRAQRCRTQPSPCPDARGVGVGQPESVGAADSRIESLEDGSHSVRGKPRRECLLIDERCVDATKRGGDDPRRGVGARHSTTLLFGTRQREGIGRDDR